MMRTVLLSLAFALAAAAADQAVIAQGQKEEAAHLPAMSQSAHHPLQPPEPRRME